MTDLPISVLGPPVISSLTPIVDPNGGIGVASPYAFSVTFTTPWGETAPSAISTGTLITPNNTLSFTLNSAAGFQRALALITGANIYLSSSAAAMSDAIKFSLPGVGPGSIVSILGSGSTYQAPPSKSSAFLPDANGKFASASTIYRWMNDALTAASLISRGIPDVSGIRMLPGQGFYTMPGVWDKLENCWYDGFPVAFDSRGGAFYRNVLSGITFIGILQTSADRQILELQPQPSRQGGVTTLSAGIGITDSSIPITSTSQIGLPLGMLMIGTEIVSYGSLSGGNAIGVSRGLGGTQQQAWPAGTQVTELNFRFGGLRLSQQVVYKPGDSLITLQVPPGWKQPLTYYLNSRFSDAEQDQDGGEKALKRFVSFVKEYNLGTKQVAGPRQVGMVTTAGDGYPSASSGGRVIVP